MNEYRAWNQSVRAPEELKHRVLRAAERRTRRRGQRAVKWAACAACVLAVVLGVTWGEKEVEAPRQPLVLTASAAEPGANGGLVFLGAPAELADTAVELAVAGENRLYRLTAEDLRACVNEDGSRSLVPVLAGDEAELTGLYAAPEDSRWLLWPVEGSRAVSLSAPYGLRKDTGYFHAGIDIPAAEGTAITAAAAGTVTEAGFDAGLGHYLTLDHGDGLTTTYGQCRTLLAAEGDTVEAGAAIAEVGATGMATGPHLHFEVRRDGGAENPVAYFDADIRALLRGE
ncbi:MAG: M23 family metallopeptidase [Oscillibacter sp.]|nr:M23 family metallopeptidase [Oscillibacter sp.]